jgi:hypothetical protein
VTSFYSYWMVLLSTAPAIVSSYTTRDHPTRVAASTGRSAQLWPIARAFSIGVGIGSMHFIGMLSGKNLLVGGMLMGFGIGAVHYAGSAAMKMFPPIPLGAHVRSLLAAEPRQQLAADEMTQPIAYRLEAIEVHERRSAHVARALRVRDRPAGAVLARCAKYTVGQLGQAVLVSDAPKEARRFKLRNSNYISDHKVVPAQILGTRG